ncbi:stage III sporulation protein SpoIIIAB [Clostridium fallax]|uniref:Stage III sporulation protein AB n=1 Tax=Clostridium fallax TaxID=1533 RepID=A0A1M4XMP8_9CLOT|nr:stage III sporulation protein SpoIIIAB [Clostridium fallax]SHE94864.1 stage III sporulation protein AB [Clostridium fallax]SQB06338.1 stage III sporulation protein SpoAB [Clostridium fallax]
MIKYVFLALIFILTTYIGSIYGSTFKKRLVQLKNLEDSLMTLEHQITYVMTPLPDGIKYIAEKSKKPLQDYYMEVYKIIESGRADSPYEAFVTAYDKEKNNLNLKEEDMEIVFDFGKNLGQTSVEGQQKIFTLILERIKKQIKFKEEECVKNEKLYKYLGVCSGIMIVIFLI